MKIAVEYKSGWYVVIFPTLQFLIILFGIPMVVGFLSKNDFLVFLSFIVSFVLALVLAVVTYPFYLKFMASDTKRNFGGIELNDKLLTFQIGKGKKQVIDLNQEYKVEIAADKNATQLNIYSNDYKSHSSIFISGINRSKVLELYPAKYFLNEIAISPEMGMFGFDLNAKNPEALNLVTNLLLALWETRRKNTLFSIYKKFTWEKHPHPESDCIRTFDVEYMSLKDKELITKVEREILSSPVPYLAVTPDYLIGYEMKTFLEDSTDYFKGKKNIIKKYFLMPLGKISAEVVIPAPDFKDYLAGKTIISFVSSIAGQDATGKGVYLQDVRYLEVSGYGASRELINLLFEWPGPADDNYDESKFFVRFINRRGDYYAT